MRSGSRKQDPAKVPGGAIDSGSATDGTVVCKPVCARRHTGVSMKHFSEMLLSLKPRARADINQGKALLAQHRLRKFHPFECHVQMRRVACHRFESACKV